MEPLERMLIIERSQRFPLTELIHNRLFVNTRGHIFQIMSFLNSTQLLGLLPTCISPYDPERIKSGAYELSMGDEYFTTNTETATKNVLAEKEQFVIEPGQFALLITKEIIFIPASNLGFISVKAGIKFRGLINVSGFHVDPGFHGRLKFSVYNAGSRAITLEEGQRLFPLWLSEFTEELTDDQVYAGQHQNQQGISSEDVSKIEGAVLSPAVLDKKIREVDSKVGQLDTAVRNKDANITKYGGIIIAILIAVGVKYILNEIDQYRWNQLQQNQLAITAKLEKAATRDSLRSHTLTVRLDSALNALSNAKANILQRNKIGNKQ
ncbi:dCTP deaminase domain-containing protein [Hymenobacter sublimis]|uniref:dUTPase-like domain-containing protein n=1 Tax=Hymenobacter sublimis TaxID=2933777 RepID=A0ABY4JE09_9BACT|nr:hypothetical protein [Hymenobacter sublimis]UPL50208.1 hypothetical protein MWH26_04690 [Hymenobacter sublimis]